MAIEGVVDDLGHVGWAVITKGAPSLRTASTSPEGAMINGLVLLYGVSPIGTWSWTPAMIQHEWERHTAAQGSDAPLIRKVRCIVEEW